MMPDTKRKIAVRQDIGHRRRFCRFGYPQSRARALTLIEIIVSLAIITIIITVIVPLFVSMRNSWDSKQAAAEALQNGRILIDHLHRNLSKAVRITAVSDSAVTSGYIEFEDNDGDTLRYDIAATKYVKYGVVGRLKDLAGPVSQLQFTCYDANDFNTPIVDVNSIRLVRVETTLTNAAALGQDKTFIAQAYLRTNASDAASLGKYTAFEFDATLAQNPALAQIDSTHYLCAYSSSQSDGFAVVLTVDINNTWDITAGTALEYDTQQGLTPALAQIDSTHYLCAYTGEQSDGFAVVLTVDTGTWNITAGTPLEYDTGNGETPALAQLDSTHYLCVYAGGNDDGWAVVLTVDTGTWTVTAETPFEYEAGIGQTPALAQIDSTHYLCAYTGEQGDGFAVVLTVDTGTWNITAGTPFEYEAGTGQTPALAQIIDESDYLCAYTGSFSDGWAVVLNYTPGGGPILP